MSDTGIGVVLEKLGHAGEETRRLPIGLYLVLKASEVGWEINLEKVDPVKANKKSSFKPVSYKTAMQLCGRTSLKDNGQYNTCKCNYASEEAEGIAIVDDILKNGDKHFIVSTPTLLPSWYSHELIMRGQEYFHNNMFNMFVAKLSGLLALLSAPSVLQILYQTNKSSKPTSAYKRYMGTIRHMILWYQSDLRNPNSKGRQSIATVRAQHAAASKLFGPITQKDLALTQFGFVGIAVMCAKQLGLPPDQNGLIHFWGVIGHLMGIQERFNLCRGNMRCTTAACEEMAKRYFVLNLDNPPEYFEQMSKSLLQGMWPLVVFFHPLAFKEHTRRLCGCPPKSLPIFPLLFLYIQILVHKMLQIQFLSFFLLPFLNFQVWFTIFVQNTMPIIAFFYFHYSLSDQ